MAEVFTEANRAYFDGYAKVYDSKPWIKEFCDKISMFLQANLDFIDPRLSSPTGALRLLDYACGTGTITGAIGAHATTVVGVDIAPGMVQIYNERFAAAAAAAASRLAAPPTAVVGDLLSATPSANMAGAEYHGFDVAAVGMGFHHFHDPGAAVKRLAGRLKPGGVLFIVDFCPHGEDYGTQHAGHAISRHGFSEEDMKGVFEDAGLADVGYKVLTDEVVMESPDGSKKTRKAFLGRAAKPAA